MNHALSLTTRLDRRLHLRRVVGGATVRWSQARRRVRGLSWVLSGKFALMGANAILMVFLAHRLELKTYGLLVITISAQLLISRFLMMGVDTGMIRLSGVPELSSRSQEVVTAGLVVMLYTTGAFLVTSLAVGLALRWFDVRGLALTFVVMGAIGTSLVDYGYSFCLARQKYPLASLAQGGTALWRLLLTALANIFAPAFPLVVFVAYHGASLISGLAQTLMISRANTLHTERSLVKRLLRYSFWQGKANVIAIFALYEGTFILTLLGQQAATGIFGLGLVLSLGFLAIYAAYFEYLLARITSVSRIEDLGRFMRRAFGGSFLLTLACLPAIFAIAALVPKLLRPELWNAVPIFYYLSASMVLLIFQSPLEAASHYLLRPQLVSFGWLLRALSTGVAGLILGPRLGAMGAAIAQLIGSVLALATLASLVFLTFRSAERTMLSQPKEVVAADNSGEAFQSGSGIPQATVSVDKRDHPLGPRIRR